MASPQDVLNMIKENEAKFVDFRFTDTRGKEQHVTVPVSAFDEDKFESGHAFDGSSIAGWKGIQASDMLLMPDAATAANTNPVLPPEGPAPVAGRDYEEIAGGQPYAPLNGQVEVVEVFGYVCPACGAFAPRMSAWKARLPADVRVSYVPVAFGKAWEPYAKAFYAAEAKGLVDKTHDAVFNAIHLQRTLPGEGKPPADPAQLAKFYAGYGADPQEFVALMNSFATNAKMGRGMQFAQRSGVTGTPTLIVNGKYRVTGGSSWDDVLRIADHLIAMERAKR